MHLQKCHLILQEDIILAVTPLGSLLPSDWNERLKFSKLNLPIPTELMGVLQQLQMNHKWEQEKQVTLLPYSLSTICRPLLEVGEFRGNENTYLTPSVEFTLPEATVSNTVAGFFRELRHTCRGRDEA